MKRGLDGLNFQMTDVYPNMSGSDTGEATNPDVSDHDALNEDVATSEKATVNESSKKHVLLALVVLVLAVVFLGVGGGK